MLLTFGKMRRWGVVDAEDGIVRINLSCFPGDTVDLSSAEAFEIHIPPGDGDYDSSSKLERRRDVEKLRQTFPDLVKATRTTERFTWESAATTPWERPP